MKSRVFESNMSNLNDFPNDVNFTLHVNNVSMTSKSTSKKNIKQDSSLSLSYKNSNCEDSPKMKKPIKSFLSKHNSIPKRMSFTSVRMSPKL